MRNEDGDDDGQEREREKREKEEKVARWFKLGSVAPTPCQLGWRDWWTCDVK
jgi:hypothetical protein